MGPGFVHPGNQHGWLVAINDSGASMGPGFVHPGNQRIKRRAARRQGASMGPGFVHPGNIPWVSCAVGGDFRFNGARVCTPGKSGTWRESSAKIRRLQWGPGLYTREMTAMAARERMSCPLQWGPGLYTREIAAVERADRWAGRCFNGARVCTPGKYDPRLVLGSVRASFNGARVCTPGKFPWRRVLAGRHAGFNGARVCTPGKCPTTLPKLPRPRGRFNGARVCTPGKCDAAGAQLHKVAVLQWGPGLYTREIGSPRGRPPPWAASMGPGFVHPGNTELRAPLELHYPLQWGPGLYTREIVAKLSESERGDASMGPGFVHPGNG